MSDRQRALMQLHDNGDQGGAPERDVRETSPDVRAQDLQTLADLELDVFPTYTRYDKFEDYRLATGMLAVGKYWTGSSRDDEFQKASELMKEQLIKGAKRSIRMSQMDLISAWKKNWSDHVVCQWVMAALLANKSLTVQVVVSPLDAGAGAEGDQYSFGSGAVRTFDLIKYYMTHDAQSDAVLPDRDGARAEALSRLYIAPMYFTDAVPDGQTVEGTTYKWPDLAEEGYTATLKQPPLSEQPPRNGVIGSAAMSVINASGYIYKKVPSAPGNHAKVMIIDDEAYVVGSDNLYPGFLSEFNYLIEGEAAVGELLRSYWQPLWRYSGPHSLTSRRPVPPSKITLVAAAASSELKEEYNGKPQTAERLLENRDATFWNSDDKGMDPTPWFWVKLQEPTVVSELKIRWKSTYGVNGARAMKYRVLASRDSSMWTDTGRTEKDVSNLNVALDTDKLAGWSGPTQFIKVEMSESSYGRGAYFTCHGVEVFGTPS